MSKRFPTELAKTNHTLQALQLCRRFDALWMPDERAPRWQMVVDVSTPGSLADQLSRVFLTRALLDAGEAAGAEVVILGLPELVNPFVHSQSIAVSAEIARAKGNITESARLYARAVQIDRPTALPPWYKGLLKIKPPDAEIATSELQAWAIFLRGCNDLIEGDYTTAVDRLSRVGKDSHSIPNALQCSLPCMMLLACLGTEDYAEAEVWGRQALALCHSKTPDEPTIQDQMTYVKHLDTAVLELLAMIRDESNPVVASEVSEQAIRIYDAGVKLSLSRSDDGIIGGGIQKLYALAKRRQIAQLLIAEYRYAMQRWLESGKPGFSLRVEPLFFVGQVLRDVPFDQIMKSFTQVTGDEDVRDQICRFARFTLKAGRLDLATSALNVDPGEQLSASFVEVLEDIAEIYLAASNHHKAIAVYEIIATKAEDLGKAISVQLKIIEIYAENLKNYDKAIQECQKFIQRHPDSAQTSQVEFLVGRLSYLAKDYDDAVGRLDGFMKRYPEHPQVGPAMLIAGLSCMAEGNTQKAIGRFTEVIRRYPEDDLAARSKFLIGYAHVSDQQYATALETFMQLIEQFPKSQYVPQAQSLIDRLSRISP
jgi:outer membrane protein assembly factor BamD (BamD/ComL family)